MVSLHITLPKGDLGSEVCRQVAEAPFQAVYFGAEKPLFVKDSWFDGVLCTHHGYKV